jgi:hypothetical protein
MRRFSVLLGIISVFLIIFYFSTSFNESARNVESVENQLEGEQGVELQDLNNNVGDGVERNKMSAEFARLNRSVMQLSKSIELLSAQNVRIASRLDDVELSFKQGELQQIQPNSSEKEDTTQDLPVQNVAELFEQIINSEQRDDDWSASAEDSLKVVLSNVQNVSDDMTINETYCQSSMCRVSYQLSDTNDLMRTIESVENSLGWESKAYTKYDVKENGDFVVSSFYMRENYDYPAAISELQ